MAIQRLTENTVREAPATTARLRPANFDAAEIRGRALEGFGKQLGQVAEAVDEITYKYDLAAAKKADAEDAIELARIRAEALSAVGTEAPTAAEEARKAAEQIRKTRLSSLKGRRGELYANSFNQRMASFEGQLTEHSIKQADAAERGAAAGRAETSLTLAIDSYSDPQAWRDNIVTAEREFRAANRGKAEDQLAREWSEARSKAHVSVVKSIMASDPDGAGDAEKWIDDHAAEIDPVHEPELRKSLQPLLDDQLADADFARAMAGVTTPDDGEDDASAPTPAVPRAKGEPIRKVEDHLVGGKGRITSTATARRAGGRQHNALDIAAPAGTAIRPPMSGKVKKAWLDTDHGGGWSLLIEHPNGMVTGYAHMKSRPAVEEGQEVDSTTIVGSVGSTGRSTGNHLHFTVRDAKGVKVDPQSIDWAAVAGSGGPKTVDPAKVKWKEGELPRYTADKNMLNEAMNAVYRQATKEGWSKRRYDAAIAKAREFAGVSEQLFNAQYDDLKDRVYEKIASLDGGDGLTNINQLGTDYGLLRGQDKLTITNLISANKKALEGDKLKANGDEYVDWRLMAGGSSTERQLFLQQDFRANPNMTAAERARLSIMQQDMRKDENGTLAADIDRVRSTVNRYAPEAGFNTGRADKGIKEDRRRRAILIDRSTNLINRRQKELGRPLNDIELDGIIRSQIVSITRDGETRPLYLERVTPKKPGAGPATVNVDETYENIPTAVRDQITRSLQRRGIAPTPQKIIEIYLEGSR